MSNIEIATNPVSISTMELADKLIDGVATDIEADALAFRMVAMLASCFSTAVDCLNNNESGVAALDDLEFHCRVLRNAVGNFSGHQARFLERFFLLLQYANAVLIPEVVLGGEQRTPAQVNTYIFRQPLTGLFKIGRTSNITQRMKSLETGAGAPLELCLVISGDVEQELHKKFLPLRVFREWFSDDGQIAEFIEQRKNQCATTSE